MKQSRRGRILSELYKEKDRLAEGAQGTRGAVNRIKQIKKQIKQLQREISTIPERRVLVEKKKRGKKY